MVPVLHGLRVLASGNELREPFRTGEMPIGIAGYELFNRLTVFARK